jgi:hypothetical protein
VHSDWRIYISREFVQLFDRRGRRVNLAGSVLDNDEEKKIFCGTPGCGQVLFGRDDLQPWSHVLASNRLSDLDAFLEYEHAWGPGRPALFVRRLAPGADVVVRNVRWAPLRQGMMEIGDLHCRNCAAQLGWKFIAELPNGLLRNYDQVGRYGMFRDALFPCEPQLL